MRVSVNELKIAVAQLNARVGTTPYKDEYFLQGAYGGWQLMRRSGQGAISVTSGFRPKRELFEAISYMMVGISEYVNQREESQILA